MVSFEYKVVGIKTFQDDHSAGHVKDSVIESVINKYAAQGWEYQNAIVSPTTQCRDYIYFPQANLVFRRAKSCGTVFVAGNTASVGEEKNEFDVILVDGGEQKLNVIKVLRAAVPELDLKDAKDLVDKGNAMVKEAAAKDEAEKLKKELEDAGAKVMLK